MDKSISQFREISKANGEEYLLLAYPNINNVKIKVKNLLLDTGVSGGISMKTVWLELASSSTEQINKSHITGALSGYATESWVKLQGFLTEHLDISNLITKTEASQTYQPKGDYLTAIPEEYITNTELEGKGYATTIQVSEAVADKLTKTQADGYYQTKGDYALKSELPDTSQLATKTELAAKADKVSTENVSENTKEIQPNRYYMFGEMAELTITLAEGEEGKLNEYMFEFVSGTTPTTLSLPESVKWMGDSTIEASKTYQVSIVNNIAVMGGAS